MKIEIKNQDTKSVTKLISKFLEMNENSSDKYNYLDNDTLYVGYNANSGFSYIYLENQPSLALCLDYHKELCIVYSSSLDGLEFISYDIPIDLTLLEDFLNKAYDLEYEIREDDYSDEDKKEDFIDAMELNNKWSLL